MVELKEGKQAEISLAVKNGVLFPSWSFCLTINEPINRVYNLSFLATRVHDDNKQEDGTKEVLFFLNFPQLIKHFREESDLSAFNYVLEQPWKVPLRRTQLFQFKDIRRDQSV